ncbi:hypothetical protein ABZU75_25775, partial [Streptosporangium sp. NPDC005286]|uniref:hypothetical protein n=1 Tax=Streptosporangium sp. NPDC005286 TaxID=3154463 RepID=UPI0033AEED5D
MTYYAGVRHFVVWGLGGCALTVGGCGWLRRVGWCGGRRGLPVPGGRARGGTGLQAACPASMSARRGRA